MGFFNRLAHGLSNGWNAFMGRDPTNLGRGSYHPPDRAHYYRTERTIITSVYTRIAIDAASVSMRHVITDEEGRYLYTKNSGLNECLNVEANIDQAGREFKQSLFMNLLDEGIIGALPVEVINGDIKTMRVAKIVEWFPKHVKVNVYNEATGQKVDLIVPKRRIAIINNPFYSVMNEPNSTAQRLNRKLAMLDQIDEQSSSGKFNIIIQLPYLVKSEARQKQAEKRRADIEAQLTQSKYGIAYTDGTEKVTQLNRAIENNLLEQIKYYKEELFNELGMTMAIFDGTADDQTRLNYYNGTVEPILAAARDAFIRTFLSKTARTQGQSVMFFRDQFGLVPLDKYAEIAASMKQSELMSTNELRQRIGLPPDADPKSDQLANPNINPIDSYPEEGQAEAEEPSDYSEYEEEPEY